MRRFPLLSLFVAACAGSGGGGFPPPSIPARPIAEDFPDAGAAVLDDVRTLEYRVMQLAENAPPRVVAVMDHRRRIKILSEAGKREAEVSLDIDEYSTITKVLGRSVDTNGRPTGMTASAVRLIKRANPEEDAPGLKVMRFTVPEPPVGGLVEYRYTRVFTAPDLVPIYAFGDRLPVLRSEFNLVRHPDIKLDFRYGDGERLKDVQPLRRELGNNRERLVFVELDLPPFYDEPNMPHRTRVAPWIAVTISRAKLAGDVIRLETWSDVADRVRGLFDKVGGEASRGTPEARYQRVRDNIKGVQLPGLGVRRPIGARGITAGEKACTRDAAALLLAQLRGSGARAYPALITSAAGPPVFEGFPAMYPFIRAVVAVDVTEKIANDPTCKDDPISRGLLCTVPPDSYAFLDPLCPGCRFGELPTELTGGRALVLVPNRPRWVDVPEDPPERNRVMAQFRLALAVNGKLKGKVTGEITGAPARSLRRSLQEIERSAGDPIINDALLGTERRLEMAKLRVKHRDDPDQALEISGKVTTDAEKISYENFVLHPIEFAGSSLPGRWRSSRRYDAVLPAPAWVETVASIDLPVGYEVESKGVTKIVKPFAEYAAGFARRDRVLHYSRRLVIKRHIISAEDWRDFHAMLEQIEALEEGGVRVWLQEE